MLEGIILWKKTRGRRWIQAENSIYADMKKSAEDRSIWWTLRRFVITLLSGDQMTERCLWLWKYFSFNYHCW